MQASDRMLCIAIRMEILRIALAYDQSKSLTAVLRECATLENFVFESGQENLDVALDNLRSLRPHGKA